MNLMSSRLQTEQAVAVKLLQEGGLSLSATVSAGHWRQGQSLGVE